MTAPSLRIELERARVALGDEVAGAVVVEPASEGLREVEVLLVHQHPERGELIVGRTRAPASGAGRFPFRFPVPCDACPTLATPATRASWSVEARLDVPWAVDPRQTRELAVDPREVPDRDTFLRLRATPPLLAAARRRATWWPWAAVCCAVATLLSLPLALFIPHFVVLLVLLSPLFALLGLLRLLGRTRVRAFRVTTPAGPRLLGEWIPLDLSFRLRRPIRITGLEVALVGAQTYSTGSGKQRQSVTVPFSETRVQLLGPCVLAPEPGRGEVPVSARVWARLPRDGFPSTGGAIHYTAQAELAVVGWPDPQDRHRIEVLPGRLPAAQEAPAPAVLPASSPGLLVVAEGAELPYELDRDLLGERPWRWVIAPALGLLQTLWGALLTRHPDWVWATTHVGGREVLIPDPTLTLQAGLALLLGGLAALAWKLAR